MTVPPISAQVALLIKKLGSVRSNAGDPKYQEFVSWIKDLPPNARHPELLKAVAKAYNVAETALASEVSERRSNIPEFDMLIPLEGWLNDYVTYTRDTEPPTPFHFFAGAVVLGAAMRRQYYFDRGAYGIFPNLCVVIIAPTGRCRKTSACNMAVDLLRRAGGEVIQDKATPEALADSLKERPQATALIYAPELAVFLGKQKYQEGMIPMLTALFDAPKQWSSLTINRGGTVLTNVALSFLGCTTIDWMQTSIPRDIFGGGFMSRILHVVQNTTPRCFPIPPPRDDMLRQKLVSRLIDLRNASGQFKMSEPAYAWFDAWYRTLTAPGRDEKQFAGYYERKSDHLIRLSMVMQASKGSGLELERSTMESALRILDWCEAWMPNAFEEMIQTAVGADQMRLLAQLKKKGGTLTHSDWLRMNSQRMNAKTFREHTETLRAAKLIDYDGNSKMYYLTPAGHSQVE